MGKIEIDGKFWAFTTLLFVLIFLTIFIGYELKSMFYLGEKEIVKGQIWVREDSRDPFKEPIIDTFEILEVRGNYALIRWNGEDTMSMERELVSCCGKRLLNE